MKRKTKKTADDDVQTLLLSKAELALHLRCSERQIDKLTADGRIPQPIMLGSTRRWRRSVIIAWLDRTSTVS